MESHEDLKAQAVQDVVGPFLLEWLAGGWLCAAGVGRVLKQSELGLSSFMPGRSPASGELLTAGSSPPFTLSPQYWFDSVCSLVSSGLLLFCVFTSG